MTIEEFAAFGCYHCGSHDFTKPIGTETIQCAQCGKSFDLSHVGELDSDFWMQLKAEQQGLEYSHPDQVRYKNEEQFINNMTDNVKVSNQ